MNFAPNLSYDSLSSYNTLGAFCTPENVEASLKMLQLNLESCGLPSTFPLDNLSKSDTVSMVNLLHNIAQQRQRDLKLISDLNERLRVSENENTNLSEKIKQLKGHVSELEHSLTASQERERQSEDNTKRLKLASQKEKDEYQKKISRLQQRENQFQQEKRKQEIEFDKMKTKLSVLTVQKPQVKKTSAPNPPPISSSQEAIIHQQILQRYEEREALLQEQIIRQQKSTLESLSDLHEKICQKNAIFTIEQPLSLISDEVHVQMRIDELLKDILLQIDQPQFKENTQS
eukprot:TRINITY_DN9291_c0_g1_i1.p1 TRINITY_DN9291_c0_g1~~TRINITY_DN9291_c0_g1_i1.p1  ORF type:complete len:288 (+),score=54.42 TRINITY_DN9291_c0_g1_i1:1-864(+)